MEDFIFGDLNSNTSRFEQQKAYFNGVSHAQQRSPLDPGSSDLVTLRLIVGPEHALDRAWVYYTTDGTDPVGANGSASNGSSLEMTLQSTDWETLIWDYVRHFSVKLPAFPAGTVVRYRISAGNSTIETFADDGKYYAWYVNDDPAPAWAKHAVIYQIFTDRFFSEDPAFPSVQPKPILKCNGTIKGITAKLDHIKSLGVNALWLTPVFPSPSYHHYDATSFTDIDPRLGTKEDFKELLEQAKARGIRFIMDLVPNHWSSQHPSFQSATNDPNSEYREWYTFFEWPSKYESFFTVKNLPQINLRNPQARQHVIDAAAYWLEFGVDAFRVDYCIGPTPDFYADLRKRTKQTKPDSWIFGEAIDTADVQKRFFGNMDGALDFMLLNAFRNTFATMDWDLVKFNDFLDRHKAFFPQGFTRPSFLDNHDMNRFLWVARGDKRRLLNAAFCQFSLPQAPIIYYGTEVGLSQHRDMLQNGHAIHEEGRLPMLWGSDQDAELLATYQDLAAFRHTHPEILTGELTTLFVDREHWAYEIAEGDQKVIALFNLSAQDWNYSLILDEFRNEVHTGMIEVISLGKTRTIKLRPASAVLISDH